MRHIIDVEREFGIRDVADDHRALARHPGLLQTLRDLILIALAWALLIGVIMYPAAQLVGLLACAVALWAASRGKRPAVAED